MTSLNPRTSDPTKLGTVEDVSGATVRVKLSDETATGLVFVNGEGYRVGQVGSFVRIPAGHLDLFGIVSQVGAGAAPIANDQSQQFGDRWLRLELVGQGSHRKSFDRGISQYPVIGDAAHLVTESDLSAIYTPGDHRGYVRIGKVASAESIPAYLNVNKLITRHSAVVGSTGAGKSTSVAGLLHSLANEKRFPGSRIVLLDLHGEYAKSFGDMARVYRVNADEKRGELPLCVPYWALTSDEILGLTTGAVSGAALASILEGIAEMKRTSQPGGLAHTVPSHDVSADTPLPFSIHQLWYDLHTLQYATHVEGQSQSKHTWALEEDAQGNKIVGDAMLVQRPKFRPLKDDKGDPEKIRKSTSDNLMRSQTDALEGKLRDPRLSFLFRPGPWTPDTASATAKDLDSLIASWVGREKPITVLDLSGIPATILDDLVGAVLRILYDSMLWGRSTPMGAKSRPLMIVLEEAHNYLSLQSKGRAAAATRRIAKEGRKYGVGLMLVSQRPSEIDPTILAQCGTLISMRLTNETDRSQVRSCASDNLEGLFSMLPVLRTGEALVVGEAVGLPVRTLIAPPPSHQRPDSEDPLISIPLNSEGVPVRAGGWTGEVDEESYDWLVSCWRSQNIHTQKP